MSFTHRASRWALAGQLAVAALVAAGCGGSSSASTSTSSQDAARLKFTQCMRDNGVNIPDSPGQGGAAAIGNIDRSKLQAAMQACRKYQRGAFGTISQSQRQEFQDAFVKFSSCMRQQGVEVPTPGQGGGGPPAGGGPFNSSDPKVQTALKACQSKLPNGGRFGGPGGAGG